MSKSLSTVKASQDVGLAATSWSEPTLDLPRGLQFEDRRIEGKIMLGVSLLHEYSDPVSKVLLLVHRLSRVLIPLQHTLGRLPYQLHRLPELPVMEANRKGKK